MAQAIITLKIMPESPEVNLDELQTKVQEAVVAYAGEGDMKMEQEPVAFGLKAIKVTFVVDESKGGTDPLETSLQALEGVQSAEVTDVRRALG